MKCLGTLALALLCLSATAAGARAAQPAGVALALVNGRLTLSAVIDPNGPWVRYDDGRLARYAGCGVFDGGAEVCDAVGSLQITARMDTRATGGVKEWRLVQGRECSFSVNVRTPLTEVATASGVTLSFSEADLTRLVLRHPELRPYLDTLLAAVDPACRWEPGAFAVAQVQARAYVAPPGVAEGVSRAVANLGSADWKVREKAAAALAEPAFALFALLRVDRAPLTPEQRRGIDAALGAFPVLSGPDRAALEQLTARAAVSTDTPPRR